MDYVISGLNFSPVASGMFVAFSELDPLTPLPKSDMLVLGSVMMEGRVVLQLVYCPAPVLQPREEKGVPLQGAPAILLSTDLPTLRWVVAESARAGMLDFGTTQYISGLRGDVQVKDLMKTSGYKAAIGQLQRMQASQSGSILSRLRAATMLGRLKIAGSLSAKAALLCFLVFGLFFVFIRTADLDARVYNLMAAVNAGAGLPLAQAHATASANQLDSAQMASLVEVVKQSGVSRFRDGDAFVMFSDPNCPACRQFEAKMEAENWPFTPLVIPVAFQEGSDLVAAGVLCSKDVSKAWTQAVSGKASPICTKGRSQVASNNNVFTLLGFNSTPTFVSMSGQVYRGTSDMPSLLAWAKSQTPDGRIGVR